MLVQSAINGLSTALLKTIGPALRRDVEWALPIILGLYTETYGTVGPSEWVVEWSLMWVSLPYIEWPLNCCNSFLVLFTYSKHMKLAIFHF